MTASAAPPPKGDDPPELCTAWEVTSGVHCSLEKGHEGPHNGRPSQDVIDDANYYNSLNAIELKRR